MVNPTGHWRNKRKVTDFIANCEVRIHDHVTRINLNVLTLGSYDIIIGMEWLAKYRVILNCFGKTFTYVVEDLIIGKVEGVSKHVSLIQIYAMKLKRSMRKGSKV